MPAFSFLFSDTLNPLLLGPIIQIMPADGTSSASDKIGDKAVLGTSAYARRTKRLINLVDNIRALGGSHVLDLPRVVVIGNQSAGKSSLVEAISGISVPRNVNTCTRCPMECRLHQSSVGPWHCKVSLRREVDERDQTIADIKEVPFGDPVYNTEDLEDRIRRAQRAILNPLVDQKFFLLDPDTFRREGSLAFSSNVVCIDVWGPHVPDLTFIDLPGIIQNSSEESHIKAVQTMTENYIEGNSLILLTITMRDDISNQAAERLARKADPQGLRTIGVLTKPDTLQPREERPWRDIMEGRSRPLRLGYFMTKQPSQDAVERKLSYSDARQAEKTFFDTQEPWKSCSREVRARMGSAGLAENLSKNLSDFIDRMLPKLRQQVAERRRAFSDDFSRLPPQIEDPVDLLHQLVDRFKSEIESLSRCDDKHLHWIQPCNAAFRVFRRDIKSTAPASEMTTRISAPAPGSPDTVAVPQPKASNGSDSDNSITLPPEIPKALSLLIEDDAFSEDSEWDHELDDDESQVINDRGRSSASYQPQPIYLDDLKSTINQHVGRQLNFNIPYGAHLALISRCLFEWKDISKSCTQSVMDVTRKVILDLSDSIFGVLRYELLDEAVNGIIQNELDKVEEELKIRIDWIVDMEEFPFTLNDTYLAKSKTKYVRRFKQVYDGMELTQTENYEKEIRVAAEVRAYFNIAYKRIIDTVPRIIDADLIRKLAPRFAKAMRDAFFVSPTSAGDFLSESPAVADQRQDLQAKIKLLDKIREALNPRRLDSGFELYTCAR